MPPATRTPRPLAALPRTPFAAILFAAILLAAVLLLLAALPTVAAADTEKAGSEPKPKTYAQQVEGLEARVGFLRTFADADGGRVLVVLPEGEPALRFLYQSYLAQGLGSNPVGLDRTFGGDTHVVRATRRGGKVFFEVENWRYQARGGGAAERRAVAGSFATSVIWATEVLAEAPDGGLLIDLSGFLLRDSLDVIGRLREAGQGDFTLDAGRSYVDAAASLVFPRNVELEAALTFTSAKPGDEVTATAPVATSPTLRVHHSLSALPEPGFTPRPFDPRTGAIPLTLYDFATPLAEPITTRLALRHRLSKDVAGDVAEPIVYYVDPGTPGPIREALLDGARWWGEAFAAAGFPGGFRVEVLPEDAHPLDLRYNVISWVHRATRGWSYGASVVDPRTGEIVRGYVLLGSQRVRQDRLIFEGLAGIGGTGNGSGGATGADPVELALDRIRQLSAHEVGHTLGLLHNFAASSYGRASVMDYPAPWVRVTEAGELDFGDAYATGVGVWDTFAIRWLYDDDADREALVRQAHEDGWPYVSDADGRGVGTAHPHGAIWDNGADPVAALREALAVRRVALEGFGVDRVAPGREVAQLARVLVPVHLYHRYQVDAAAKLIGGYAYQYRVRGDGRPGPRPVDDRRQRAALEAVLESLDPAALTLPQHVLDELTPFATGDAQDPSTDPITGRELFAGHTDPIFDPLAAARQAAAVPVRALLHPARLARLAQAADGSGRLDLEALLDRLVEHTFPEAVAVKETVESEEPPAVAATRRAVEAEVVAGLLRAAVDPEGSDQTRAQAEAALAGLADRLPAPAADAATRAHRRALLGQMRRFLERESDAAVPVPPATEPPPGSPIGQAAGSVGCGFEPVSARPWHEPG